jgi:hypothetical protein
MWDISRKENQFFALEDQVVRRLIYACGKLNVFSFRHDWEQNRLLASGTYFSRHVCYTIKLHRDDRPLRLDHTTLEYSRVREDLDAVFA